VASVLWLQAAAAQQSNASIANTSAVCDVPKARDAFFV
jgi:hypothetical protein